MMYSTTLLISLAALSGLTLGQAVVTDGTCNSGPDGVSVYSQYTSASTAHDVVLSTVTPHYTTTVGPSPSLTVVTEGTCSPGTGGVCVYSEYTSGSTEVNVILSTVTPQYTTTVGPSQTASGTCNGGSAGVCVYTTLSDGVVVPATTVTPVYTLTTGPGGAPAGPTATQFIVTAGAPAAINVRGPGVLVAAVAVALAFVL